MAREGTGLVRGAERATSVCHWWKPAGCGHISQEVQGHREDEKVHLVLRNSKQIISCWKGELLVQFLECKTAERCK